MNGTTVRLLAPHDGSQVSRWEEYVFTRPQATFFHRAGWQQVIAEVFGHPTFYLQAERGRDLVGILPLAQVKSRLFGNALVSLPFAVYGGIVADDLEASEALENEAERLAKRLEVDHLEYRNLSQRHPDWPRQDLYVTFRKPILPTDAENMKAIPRKQRAMVRKAIERGLRAEIEHNVERFFSLYADNVHRHGTPALPRRYFAYLKGCFGEDCEIMTVTTSAGEPLSSVLTFYFRNEVLPYYAGDHLRARELAANDFKYWSLLCHAREKGCTLFDYGRSKVGTGSWHFKKNWGFEPQPLFYEYRLYKRDSVPQNNPANPKYRFLIAAWRRLPLAVANRLGPMIVKYLG